MLIWSQEAFVSALALSLLHSLWQGALVGLAGLALHKRLKQAAPELRCGAFTALQLTFLAVWLGTFLCLYVQSAHSMAAMFSGPTGSISAEYRVPILALAEMPAPMRLLQSLSPMLVAAWAIGVCTLSLRHLGGLLLLHRLCSAATMPCQPTWEACAKRLTAQMGIGRKVLLRCSEQIDVPFAFGLFKSTILLPASALMGLAPEQAEALIAHELAHIARHDLVFNFVQVCVETVLFYHPVVWWLSTQIRVAREQRCDDLAVQMIGDRALYARALYSLEEARGAIPQLALGAKGDNSKMANWHLIHRIQRVLGVSGPEKRDPWAKGAPALCAAAIGLATLMPLQAYSRPTPQEKVVQTTVKQTKTQQGSEVTTVTKVQVNIKGDKIELATTTPTADTPLKVNGQEKRFGDLTAQQQKELTQALKAVHVRTGRHRVNVKVHKGANSTSVDVKQNGETRVLKIRLNLHGDKIEFNTVTLTPDTLVTVNGKEGRFGDLTAQQQKELQAAVADIHILSASDGTDVEEGHPGAEASGHGKSETIIKVRKVKSSPPPTPAPPATP
jgi:beta-lactamase regulating signal transducer with metallopeptidase domain